MAKPAKVTRILHSQDLHRAKYDRLIAIAALCGRVRADAWQRCSGLSTAPQSAYAIRNVWMAAGYDWHGLPAVLGRASLLDALGDINACREAAKVPVKKAIWHKTMGNAEERHRLYSLLKRNQWDADPFLHRQMRKQWKGGHSHCTNQIVLEPGAYTAKVWHRRAWLYMQCLERGQRLAIPLRGATLPTGTLRLILQDDGQVEIHHAVDEDTACSTKPCGSDTVGVDKGYTEAYTDSEGERHGEGLGDLLARESDHVKVKGESRNKLRAVERKHRAAGRIKKADNIRRNNLGDRKWDRRKKLHNAQVREFLCKAAHGLVDNADTIACEDLTANMKSAQYRHRDTKRRLAAWGQGRDGGHPHLDISAPRFGAGVGKPRLHVANRFPHRPVAGHAARGSVLRPGRSRVGCGYQRRPQHPAAHVRRRDYAVHALPGGQTPAAESNRDIGGDGSTRTRACHTAHAVLTGRERITQPC